MTITANFYTVNSVVLDDLLVHYLFIYLFIYLSIYYLFIYLFMNIVLVEDASEG